MRAFLGVVAACFVGLGIAMIILVVPRLLDGGYFGSFESALMAWVETLTPGGTTIIIGSVTYMLCSIDARLQDIAENGRSLSGPKAADPFAMAQSPATSADPEPVDGAPAAAKTASADTNHGLF